MDIDKWKNVIMLIAKYGLISFCIYILIKICLAVLVIGTYYLIFHDITHLDSSDTLAQLIV